MANVKNEVLAMCHNKGINLPQPKYYKEIEGDTYMANIYFEFQGTRLEYCTSAHESAEVAEQQLYMTMSMFLEDDINQARNLN